ncbi:MAG TPA: hypothetical protein DIT04_10770, partial [Dysgonomonas sp.]|nr:hypothetical protein [Dysgonomonas sp.]
MSYFYSAFIQRLFARYFNTKPTQNERVPSYIGKTSEEIILLHKDCMVDKESSLIEIRLTEATLTCEMYNNICIDARLFRDKDLLS